MQRPRTQARRFSERSLSAVNVLGAGSGFGGDEVRISASRERRVDFVDLAGFGAHVFRLTQQVAAVTLEGDAGAIERELSTFSSRATAAGS